MCNIQALLTNGILLEVKKAETSESEDDFTAEYVVLTLFQMLLLIYLEENVVSMPYSRS
jgi:hypothetical protein